MYRTFEAIFRRPIQILSLVILLPIISLAIAYVLPRSYQATASLWAARRYAVIGATGPESDLQATPADTQATALTELLQTRTFALTVANNSGLASMFDTSTRSNAQNLNDAMFTEISKHVTATSLGYNLFTITYTNTDGSLAQKVIANVVQAYNAQSQSFSSYEGTQLLQGYQTQLVKAQSDAKAAVAAETQYIANNPQLDKIALQSDPQYTLLHAQTLQAQGTVQNIQATITTIQQEIQDSTPDALFRVIDQPAILPVSRTKTYLTVGGIGLGVGILAVVLIILIEMRRDRAIYSANDLQKIAPLPVILQLPHVEQKTLPQLLEYGS